MAASDEDILKHGLAVGAATKALNDATQAAFAAGLKVELNLLDLQTMGREETCPIVEPSVYRPIPTKAARAR